MNYLGPDEAADFTSRLRRQGGTQNAQAQPFQFPSAPTNGFKPQGITPPGPNHSQQWFGGPGQELTKGGDPSGFGGYQPTGKGPGGFQRPGGGYDGSGINPGGMYGGSPIQGGPYGPPQPDTTDGPGLDPRDTFMPTETGGPFMRNPYGHPGNTGPIPPHWPPRDGQMDPKYPLGVQRPQPVQTRNQWQQNRLGNQGPQIPVEKPIFPTNDWNGGQGNNRGW